MTSASAFAANTLSEIPALSDFGLLTALIISSNYVLLVLVITATLGFWWRYVKPIEDRVVVVLKWLIWCPVMLAATVNAAKAKKTTPRSPSDPGRKMHEQRQLRLGKGSLPSDNHDDDEKSTSKRRKCKTGPTARSPAVERIAAAHDRAMLSTDEDAQQHEGTFFSWFLYTIVGGVTVKGRYVCVGVYAVFAVFACQQASLLQPAQKPPALVPDEHNLGKVEALAAVFDNWDSSGGDLGGAVLVNGGVVTVTDITATKSPTSTRFPSRAPTTPVPTPVPTSGQPTRAPTRAPTSRPRHPWHRLTARPGHQRHQRHP